MALDQDTVDAGIDPYAPQIAKRQKRAASLEGDVERLGKKGEVLAGEEAKLFEERGAARKPTFQALEEKLKTRPSAQVSEEHVPDFQRPKGNGKELEQGMSALAVAAMLVGVATRQPFYGMAQAMNGFMKGYMDADEKVVHESMQTYDKNLAAIKERNASKRRAVEAVLKDYDNDLLGMQQQLKIIAAQYDDPILAQKVRVGSITDQRDIALKQLSVEGNAIDHLVVASESMKLRHAMLAERVAKRTAATGLKGKPLEAYNHNEANIDALRDVLKRMKEEPGAFGFKTLIPGMFLNRMDTEGTPIRASLANVTSMTIKDRAGTAQTVSEMKNLAPFIPRDGDDEGTVAVKINGMIEQMERMNRFIGASGPTPPAQGAPTPSPAAPIRTPGGIVLTPAGG